MDPGERIIVDNIDFSENTKVKAIHESSDSLLASSEMNIAGRERKKAWKVRENPVFEGENRAYYPAVLKIENNYQMWYTDKEAGEYVIKKTTSNEGVSWSEAISCEGLAGQPNHSVVTNTGTENSPRFRVWYSDASSWPYNENSFRTAVSTDGVKWENDVQCENLFDGGDTGEWYSSYGSGDIIYNPEEHEGIDHSDPMGNKFVLYYDIATQNVVDPNESEVTALAYSDDGIHWHRYGNKPIIQSGENGTWDDNYTYVRGVIETQNGYEAWYSSGAKGSNEGIGHLTSKNGIEWTRDDENPILHKEDPNAPSWRDEKTYTPVVIKEGDIYKMWFSGNYVIGFATKTS
ncbi:MAG: hypothetical protein ACLFUR_00620 [Candidatus Hadarchaeia archaeon]